MSHVFYSITFLFDLIQETLRNVKTSVNTAPNGFQTRSARHAQILWRRIVKRAVKCVVQVTQCSEVNVKVIYAVNFCERFWCSKKGRYGSRRRRGGGGGTEEVCATPWVLKFVL